ncbi:unnamed protein product [Gadus morhua 'NCC']
MITPSSNCPTRTNHFNVHLPSQTHRHLDDNPSFFYTADRTPHHHPGTPNPTAENHLTRSRQIQTPRPLLIHRLTRR